MSEQIKNAAAREHSAIAELLLNCEKDGTAPKYDEREDFKVEIPSNGDEIFVVSDLHLATGQATDGTYDGCENFFCDSSFGRFLNHAHDRLRSKNAILIINGDFIDFLRVTYVPDREHEFGEWHAILEEIGTPETVENLKASVSKKEKTYGLKTNDFKSVLRLHLVMRGHTQFFNALAHWLYEGHRLIIVRGNHDLEWYWPSIRNYMRLALAKKLVGRPVGSLNLDLETALTDIVLPQLTFIHDSMIIDGEFHVEHGHKYDKFAHVVGPTTLNDGQELNIPFGSFFNRYLLNTIELNYPFLDNVRPTTNILPLLIRERFPTALKLLCQHVPFMLQIIPKGYYRYMFGRVLLIALALLIPVAILIWQSWGILSNLGSDERLASNAFGFIPQPVLEVMKNFGWLILSYGLARIVAYFHLEEPASLAEFARSEKSQELRYPLITFGHTHNPEQVEHQGRWFYNTGTWIPIIENSSAEVRENKTYTFLHLQPGSSGKLEPGPASLQRWNDSGVPTEPMVLIKRAGE